MTKRSAGTTVRAHGQAHVSSSTSLASVKQRSVATHSLSPTEIFLRFVIVALIVFAVIGVARVTLSSATVALAYETGNVETEIESARDSGNALEVRQSSLSSPSRIKAEATSIGMEEPSEVKYMDVSSDVVKTDEAGNLSLSLSIGAVCANSTSQ